MIKKLDLKNADELFKLDNLIFEFDKYSLNQISEELTEPSRLYLGYYNNNNELVGFVGAQVVLDESDIIKIGVKPSNRKKGIAKNLFFNLLTELKNKNVKKIMLEVREQNAIAINFYKKMGFKIIATRKNYYENDNAKILMLEI